MTLLSLDGSIYSLVFMIDLQLSSKSLVHHWLMTKLK